MLRVVATRVASAARTAMVPRVGVVGMQCTRESHGSKETDEEFDQRYVNFFNRNDIDHWEIRKAMNDLAGEFALIVFVNNDLNVLVIEMSPLRHLNVDPFVCIAPRTRVAN